MDIKRIKQRIITELDELEAMRERLEDPDFIFDFSDLGNSIGLALPELDKEQTGDFVSGIKHGISLNNGTH